MVLRMDTKVSEENVALPTILESDFASTVGLVAQSV